MILSAEVQYRFERDLLKESGECLCRQIGKAQGPVSLLDR